MKAASKVNVPQEAFMAILKLDRSGDDLKYILNLHSILFYNINYINKS